jgi:peptidoglycan/LPS O-acetylase OafA/YrhL
MNRKIQLIDFLKGFSIFTIVVYHLLYRLPLPEIERKVLLMGGTGVHTFIFISGFGLYLSHLRKRLGFYDFIKKRFTKIYLPYIIIVSISALIGLFIPIFDNSLYAFFGHVFLYKMFDHTIMMSYGFQLWFISAIIQLYLLFNLLAFLKARISTGAFLLLGLFISISWSLLVVFLGKEDLANWNRCGLQFLWEFMLGMILAELYVRRRTFWKIKQFHLLVLAISGFILYGIMALKMGDIGKMLNDIPAMVGYTSLSIFIYQLGIKPINKFFLFTGTISYALFLTHVLIMFIVLYIAKISRIQYNLAAVMVTLVLSYFVSYFYNKALTLFL